MSHIIPYLLLSLSLCFCSKCFAGSLHNPKQFFIDAKGNLQPLLIELLALDGLYVEGDGLDEAVLKTQTRWVSVLQGQDGKERIDLQDPPYWQEISEQVQEIAQAMGLFQEASSHLQHYDYAICPGGFLDGVRFRLKLLIDAWKSGIRFDHLVFLSGERPLRNEIGQIEEREKLIDPQLSILPFKENWQAPFCVPYVTEYDMVQLVWEQTKLPDSMSESLEGRVFFINAPKGKKARPNLRGTCKEWLKDHPKSGTLLVASHPHFWIYQDLICSNVLGPEFEVDTIAPAFVLKPSENSRIVSLIFDTVAKALYECQQASDHL